MKKVNIFSSVVVMLALMMTSCGETANKAATKKDEATTDKVITPANNITIGKQVWMVDNLNVDIFRNGDSIPEVKTEDEWKKAGTEKQPAWCYYNNNPANGEPYGKLYNWYAVNDSRGLAPEGWRIPSDEDWNILTNFLGGEAVAGNKMKSSDFWTECEGEGGTNESGFSGMPGGSLNSFAQSSNIGDYGYWWSSTENGSSNAWYRFLDSTNGYIGRSSFGKKEDGFSVRCLLD